MWTINLYILTEAKGNTPEAGRVAYELETTRQNGSKGSVSDRCYLPDRNRNGAMLEGLELALERVGNDQDACMNVYTEAAMMNAHINNGNIWKWEKNGFMKADGSPVAYADLWESIAKDIREKLNGRITMNTGIPCDIRKRLEQMIRDPY